MCRFKWLHRWQLLTVTGNPSVALETPCICFLCPLPDPSPGGQCDLPPWLGTQHASARKVILTSLLRSSSLRLHLRVGDTCFLLEMLVMSEHRANSTISAVTCQLADFICSTLPRSSWEQSLLSQKVGLTKEQGTKVSYVRGWVLKSNGLSSNPICTTY